VKGLGASSIVPASQAQSTKLKPQYWKNQKQKPKKKKRSASMEVPTKLGWTAEGVFNTFRHGEGLLKDIWIGPLGMSKRSLDSKYREMDSILLWELFWEMLTCALMEDGICELFINCCPPPNRKSGWELSSKVWTHKVRLTPLSPGCFLTPHLTKGHMYSRPLWIVTLLTHQCHQVQELEASGSCWPRKTCLGPRFMSSWRSKDSFQKVT
jgi:hypothetical protein